MGRKGSIVGRLAAHTDRLGSDGTGRISAVHGTAGASKADPPRSRLAELAALMVDEWSDTTAATTTAMSAELLVAFERLHDSPPDTIPEPGTEAFDGLRNVLVGTVHEQRVLDAIEAGDLPVPDGATAAELTDRTTPGADLRFADGDDTTVAFAEVKASTEPYTIAEHLDRYPEVPTVYATSEAAEVTDAVGVVDSGESAAELHETVADELTDASTTTVGLLDDVVPELTLLLIGVDIVLKIARGNNAGATLADGRQRAAAALGAGAVAATAARATGVELIRLPVALSVRLLIERARLTEDATDRLSRRRLALEGTLR